MRTFWPIGYPNVQKGNPMNDNSLKKKGGNERLAGNDVTVEINALHKEIQNILDTVKSRALGKAIRIGELLLEQKRKLPHGSFGDWIREKLPFDVRQAQRYMRAFENQETLKASCRTHLSLTGAMEYLAETSGYDFSDVKTAMEENLKRLGDCYENNEHYAKAITRVAVREKLCTPEDQIRFAESLLGEKEFCHEGEIASACTLAKHLSGIYWILKKTNSTEDLRALESAVR